MTRPADPKDAPSVLVTAFRQFAQLMQDEVTLAKAELSSSLSRARGGLALMCVAALLALTALDVLAGALVGYLAANGLSVGTAALTIGGILLSLAVVLALMGRSRLKASALKPDRTLRNVQSDINTVREAANGQ